MQGSPPSCWGSTHRLAVREVLGKHLPVDPPQTPRWPRGLSQGAQILQPSQGAPHGHWTGLPVRCALGQGVSGIRPGPPTADRQVSRLRPRQGWPQPPQTLQRPEGLNVHWGSGQKTCVRLCFLVAAWQAGHVLETCGEKALDTPSQTPLPTPAPQPAMWGNAQQATSTGDRAGSTGSGCRPGGAVANRPGSSGSRRRGTGRGPRPPPCSQDTPSPLQGG